MQYGIVFVFVFVFIWRKDNVCGVFLIVVFVVQLYRIVAKGYCVKTRTVANV